MPSKRKQKTEKDNMCKHSEARWVRASTKGPNSKVPPGITAAKVAYMRTEDPAWRPETDLKIGEHSYNPYPKEEEEVGRKPKRSRFVAEPEDDDDDEEEVDHTEDPAERAARALVDEPEFEQAAVTGVGQGKGIVLLDDAMTRNYTTRTWRTIWWCRTTSFGPSAIWEQPPTPCRK
eukprot:2771386-Prymnesium_polylepis.2